MERIKNKGFIFSMDAFFAILLFVLVTIGIYTYFISFYSLQQQWYMSEDLMEALTKTKISEFDLESGIYPELETITYQILQEPSELPNDPIGDPGDPGDWWDTSFSRCKEIKINNAGNTIIKDFPTYIHVDYDTDMQENFKDIRFINAFCQEGGLELSFEAENHKQAEHADFWVKIPTILPAGITIAMYYGTGEQISSGQNPEQVWDEDFTFVQHLGEDTLMDSTDYDNDCINQGSTEYEYGQVDGARTFDGENDRLECGDDNSLKQTGEMTLSAWVYATEEVGAGAGAQEGRTAISTYADYSGNKRGWNFGQDWDSSQSFEFQICDQYGNIYKAEDIGKNFFSSELNQWKYIVGTYSPSNYIRLYIDNILQEDETDSIPQSIAYLTTPPTIFKIGRRSYEDQSEFGGHLDEIRVSKIIRDEHWMNQEYENMVNQQTMVTFGEEYELPEFSVCGNNEREIGEVCDGYDVNNKNCMYFGYQMGELSCDEDCLGLDLSECQGWIGADPGITEYTSLLEVIDYLVLEDNLEQAQKIAEDIINPLRGKRFGLELTIEDLTDQEDKISAYESTETEKKLGLATSQRYLLRRK